jgi:hypothetical protein
MARPERPITTDTVTAHAVAKPTPAGSGTPEGGALAAKEEGPTNQWRPWLIYIAAVVVLAVLFLAAWILPVSDFLKGLVSVPVEGDKRSGPPLIVGIRCHGPYANHTLTDDELSTVLSNHRAWLESRAKPDDKRRTNLCRAKVSVTWRLNGANLHGAHLSEADLRVAHLSDADLREADLQGADIRGADLSEADLERADLSSTKLAGTIYEPNPESLPLVGRLTSPDNQLDKLVFHDAPAALVAQREAFKKAGMRTQERQLTYAIEHTRMIEAWTPWWFAPGQKDTRPWLEKFWGKLESGFKLMAFELPSDYGMSYGRPLKIRGGVIGLFFLVYTIALLTARGRAGIWATWPADRVYQEEGLKEAVRVTHTFLFPRLQVWLARRRWRIWGILLQWLSILLIGLYFSVLSAFSLG